MKSITVFCGSSSGFDPAFMDQAYRLGELLAQRGITVVYGGAQVGLMGAVADGALARQGRVVGVLPAFLSGVEIAHDRLSELIVVDTMHQRKTTMSDLSDGSIALPGGFGTLEELFEMLTWGQLGLHHKPVGILNISGFYTHLLALLDTMVEAGFLKQANRKMLLVDDDQERLLAAMENYVAPTVGKWIHTDEKLA